MSDERQSDPGVDYTLHTGARSRADALARNATSLNQLAEQQMDELGTGQTAAPRPRWRTYAIAILRIALIVVGIPLVWVYRAELDWSIWKAAAATLVLVLLAIGQTFLAAVWSSFRSPRINENHTKTRNAMPDDNSEPHSQPQPFPQMTQQMQQRATQITQALDQEPVQIAQQMQQQPTQVARPLFPDDEPEDPSA